MSMSITDIYNHFIDTTTVQGYTLIYDHSIYDDPDDIYDVVLCRDDTNDDGTITTYSCRLLITSYENDSRLIFYHVVVGFDETFNSNSLNNHTTHTLISDHEFIPCPTLDDVNSVVNCALFTIKNYHYVSCLANH